LDEEDSAFLQGGVRGVCHGPARGAGYEPPKPSTINPEAQTLNPKPKKNETLNPKPETQSLVVALGEGVVRMILDQL